MSDRAAIQTALQRVSPDDARALIPLASQALNLDLAAAAEPVLTAAVTRNPGEHRLWQFLGLCRRDLQDSAGAHDAFSRAADLAPADPLIAHSQARTALEAGYPALPLFNRARQMAPGDGAVVLGRAAALFAQGDGAIACAQIAQVLEGNPGWVDGHIAFARFSTQVLPEEPIDASLRRALALHPQAGLLWQALFQVLIEAGNYTGSVDAIAAARQTLGPSPELDRVEAACLSEAGEAELAQRLFDQLPFPEDGEMACWPIRNYLRLGRFDEALLLAEQTFEGRKEAALWPYRALLWRHCSDPRWDWLEGRQEMIAEIDLSAHLGSIPTLAELLRTLHIAKHQPLDQSVRGGTQTDGNLLARAEPELRQLRAALLEAVRSYVDQLPPPDPAHPFLSVRRDELKVAGAWSVRLAGKGFHADHVHGHGWISSAFYVTLPETDPLDPQAGCLAFGECRNIMPNFEGFRTIQPEPGKLALFPSTLWHGTRPFGSGERMTIAFDIARPRPD